MTHFNSIQQPKAKILWYNPVNTPIYNQGTADRIAAIKLPNIEVHVVSLALRDGVHLTDTEFRASEAVVEELTMRVAHWAGNNGFSVVALGCFYDTGLDSAQENSGDAFVVAPCWAALNDVGLFGKRFSVIIGQDKWKYKRSENIVKYDMKDRLASFRSCNMSVPELNEDPTRTKSAMLQACRLAVQEDGADVLIIGTGSNFEFSKELDAELGVAVIDALDTCFLAAQAAAVRHSVLGSRPHRSENMKAMDWEALKQTGIFAGEPPIGNRVIVPATS